MWDSACRWARPRLALLAGGELIGGDRRRAERHLIVCGDCRERMESLRGAVGALGLLRDDAVAAADAPSLWPAVARQIQESRHPEPATIPFARSMWMGLGIAASALAIVGVTSWSLGGRGDRGGRPIVVKPPVPKTVVPAPSIPETTSGATLTEAPSGSRSDGENLGSSSVTPGRHRKDSGTTASIGVEATQ